MSPFLRKKEKTMALRRIWVGFVVGACALAAGVGGVVALDSGESSAASVASAPAVTALTSGGKAGASASVRALLSSEAVSAFGPDLTAARTVDAPSGGSNWTLVPARDGGVCFVIGDGNAGTRDAPALVAPLAEGGGVATRYGIAPDGIADVDAISKDGARIASAKVAGNLYVLPLGLEGEAASIVFKRPDGGTAFVWEVR